jgi:hypothetical protein
MENLLSNLGVIQVSLFFCVFYHVCDKAITFKSPVKSFLRTLDAVVLIGAIYLAFVSYSWWKATITIVLFFIIFAFVSFTIHKFFNQLLALILAFLGLLFSAIILYFKIF